MEKCKENHKEGGSCPIGCDCLEAAGTAREQEQEIGLRKDELIEGLHMGQTTCPHAPSYCSSPAVITVALPHPLSAVSVTHGQPQSKNIK